MILLVVIAAGVLLAAGCMAVGAGIVFAVLRLLRR